MPRDVVMHRFPSLRLGVLRALWLGGPPRISIRLARRHDDHERSTHAELFGLIYMELRRR